MATGDRHRVVANVPLRHWGLERGEDGYVTIGNGDPGTVTQSDFDGRLELGHAALVDQSPATVRDAGDAPLPAAEPVKKATKKAGARAGRPAGEPTSA